MRAPYHAEYDHKTGLIIKQFYSGNLIPTNRFDQFTKNNSYDYLTYTLNDKGMSLLIRFNGSSHIESPDAKKLIGDPNFVENAKRFFS